MGMFDKLGKGFDNVWGKVYNKSPAGWALNKAMENPTLNAINDNFNDPIGQIKNPGETMSNTAKAYSELAKNPDLEHLYAVGGSSQPFMPSLAGNWMKNQGQGMAANRQARADFDPYGGRPGNMQAVYGAQTPQQQNPWAYMRGQY